MRPTSTVIAPAPGEDDWARAPPLCKVAPRAAPLPSRPRRVTGVLVMGRQRPGPKPCCVAGTNGRREHYAFMQISEIMTREVETIAPDASLQQAAADMEALGVGSL